MKILVTGAAGFIGKNLVAELTARGHEVFSSTRDTSEGEFQQFCQHAEFVYHLAGVNRSEIETDFVEGNTGSTERLLETLASCENNAPIMFASSIQATRDNPYGRSKRAAENVLRHAHEKTGRTIYLFRFPNLFGKWGRPNYNSVVATFCYRVARDLPLEIHDPARTVQLAYIDDVLDTLVGLLDARGRKPAVYEEEVAIHPPIELGRIAGLLQTFKDSRRSLAVPQLDDAFTKQLYSTYLSYLPVDRFAYDLKLNEDARGSFTEFIRTPDRGQVSINVAKPGITKGNHWHHTKNEKFLVVSGEALIRFRQVGENEVHTYHVTGEMMRVLDIPTGYTHNIENIGTTDLVTVIWVNEAYDPNNPDTYFMEVQDETTQSDDHRRDASRNHTPVGRYS
ncbi:polysaccharide biosynthesis C-terminal domain-containing protein [Exiguobacterium aurantiacum]|uniref:NAD-dependent epimerase/dehydratase family protein n=1 Tax=Exiguobacterium aurantiacum TaxID=33987 RepID=A0ABY5FPN1_9BACL|nr:NAD-dependent epimerase/dehydratase family protein [Exiguobacterium aurantiacum]UTT43572.1 NAD-dependent epimerase/dehydratase family protein [Exiguobacterium aurantiacum]